MKDFKTVNEFFLSTEIRLKSSNESSYQSGKMKRRATSGKYRKSIVIVMKGAQSIIQEVLNNSRVIGNWIIGRFARTREGRSILRTLASSDALWYVLFDPVRQLLGLTMSVRRSSIPKVVGQDQTARTKEHQNWPVFSRSRPSLQ